ncbi:MAG: ABC transporter substrate-binding protein, partial [Cumulibacter sp.]
MSRRGRTRPIRALTAVAAIAVAASCSAGGADTGSESTDAQQTLRAGAVGAMPSASDPHGSLFNESDWLRFAAIYDPLVGVDGNGDPAPGLAESWEVNDDADVWTFNLRQGVSFSNGDPVTSADVMYSLGRIDDLADQNGARLGTVDMSASSAPDEHTVVLHTATPDAELLQTLAGTSFIVPEGTESFDEPVGSGPFVITEQNDTAATLVANEGWWGGEPASAEIEIRSFSGATAMNDAVTSGQIDIAIGAEAVAAEAAAGNEDLQVVTQPAASTTPLLMRLDRAPFDEPGVREAVKLAVDREALVDAVYLGYGEVGADLPHPNDPSAPDLQAPERDLDAAKQALSEAGYPDGVEVTLYTSAAYPAMEPTAILVAEQLGEAGIDVTVSNEPAETYWMEIYG